MPGQITIWENPNFSGRSDSFSATTGQLGGWEYRSASSLRLTGFADTDWNAFFESPTDFGDDMLYMQGKGELADLGQVARPHGNNNWNDRISQISFGLAPNLGIRPFMTIRPSSRMAVAAIASERTNGMS